MVIAALRDLPWRRQRFIIAIVGTGVIFAATLVLTGLANGFRIEAQRTVESLGIDTGHRHVGDQVRVRWARSSARHRSRQAKSRDGGYCRCHTGGATGVLQDHDDGPRFPRNINMFGVPDRGPGVPTLAQGRPASTPDELVVADKLGRHVGDQLEIASRTLRVVGIVHDCTALAGQPNVFLTVAGAQQPMFGGQPLVSAIGLAGTPAQVPAGYRVVDRDDAIEDFVRPLRIAYAAFAFMSVLRWIVAALIVGSVVHLSALARTRDFTVFKAVGVSTGSAALVARS